MPATFPSGSHSGRKMCIRDRRMTMRSHSNGGYVNALDECWKMCEKFNANIVFMYNHVSVSYTHLDVYKRQNYTFLGDACQALRRHGVLVLTAQKR